MQQNQVTHASNIKGVFNTIIQCITDPFNSDFTEKQKCIVCMETLNVNDPYTSCQHQFHDSCLKHINNYNQNCPICNHKL